MLLAGLALIACPGGADDDDATTPAADDDDATTPAADDDDDDATSPPDDDDDDTPLPPCSGEEVDATEVEPNDDPFDDAGATVAVAGGNVTIHGVSTECIADTKVDLDWFALPFDCGGHARFRLDWPSNQTDLDLVVYDSGQAKVAESAEWQPVDPDGNEHPPLEEAEVDVEGALYISVECYAGPATEYTLTVRWDGIPGDDDDDDDSSDDDDSAGDDDSAAP